MKEYPFLDTFWELDYRGEIYWAYTTRESERDPWTLIDIEREHDEAEVPLQAELTAEPVVRTNEGYDLTEEAREVIHRSIDEWLARSGGEASG